MQYILKHRVLIAAVLSLAAGGASATETDQAQIKSLLNSYEQVLNASDVSGVVNLYARDGVFMPQHSPSAVGIDTVQAVYQGVFEAIDLNVEFDIVEIVVVSDDWAFARTNSSGTTTINATGAEIAEGNQELFVLQKVAGDWKIARYAFSTTNPRR